MKGLAKRIVLLPLLVAVTVSASAAPAADPASRKLKDRFEYYEAGEEEAALPTYADYSAEHENRPTPAEPTEIAVDLAAGVDSEGNALPVDSDGFFWDAERISAAKWVFEVRKAGFYVLKIDYRSTPGGTEAPRRRVKIDGEIPFAELGNLELPRWWKDEGEPRKNANGDEIRPRQVQIFDTQSIAAEDALGRYTEPLRIYLEPGRRELTMECVRESVILLGLRFETPEEIPSYEEYRKTFEAENLPEAAETVKIDAERTLRKNALSVRREVSTDPLADPSAERRLIYNAVGGPGWNEGNREIVWEFEIPQTALYKLELRVLQKYNDGLSSYRQIKIDGKVPFREFLCYEFEEADWRTVALADPNGEPFCIPLKAGRHTLSMSVKTAPYRDVLSNLEQALDLLSGCIRDIIKITGINPDLNFDYELDRRIPDLMPRLEAVSDILENQIRFLTEMAKAKTNTANGLETLKHRVDRILEKPISVPKNLEFLVSDQTTLSAWITGFNNLALMLDYMEFAPPNRPVRNARAGFFDRLRYATAQFVQSFRNDYSDVSHRDDSAEPIEVWVSRGKEWAQTLDWLIRDDFETRTPYRVKLHILPAGQVGLSGVVLLALASGTEPDAVLGTDSVTPAEFGMRGAAVDLSAFDDFSEVEKRFAPGTLIPFRLDGSVYALPETLDFSVLYYREDILKTLGLKVPETWDELCTTVLPELKRNGMDFWYEGGFYTFLFQNGGRLYTADGKASALDEPASAAAFKRFTELYTVHKVPVSANFFNRFRAGQMPLGISSFLTYLQLISAAPELEGKWNVAPVPGTVRSDGTVDRSAVVTVTASSIFSSARNKEAAWAFLKWYSSAEVQTRYATDLPAFIGPSAKWFSAVTDAFDALSWDSDIKGVVREQRAWLQGLPNVAGGYITARQLENARVRTVLEGMLPRESIERAAAAVTRELETKRREFEMRKSLNGR